LVPREVQPEGQGKKIVHVLQLTSPYKLAELFKYAGVPPGQALLPAPDAEPPEDLSPEVEPSMPPAVRTIDAFFQAIPDTGQRKAAWRGIQGALTSKVVTPAQVLRWLKDNDIVMSEVLLAKDEPPSGLSTKVLDRLHEGLSQLQVRMEEPVG
jgi:hypothetical protein